VNSLLLDISHLLGWVTAMVDPEGLVLKITNRADNIFLIIENFDFKFKVSI